MFYGLILALLLAWTISAYAADALQGRARTVDGDTIVVNGHKIRLHGIDTPETDEIC